jgi:hypothetical protein
MPDGRIMAAWGHDLRQLHNGEAQQHPTVQGRLTRQLEHWWRMKRPPAGYKPPKRDPVKLDRVAKDWVNALRAVRGEPPLPYMPQPRQALSHQPGFSLMTVRSRARIMHYRARGSALAILQRTWFNPAVRVLAGRRVQHVTSLQRAAEILLSEDWPVRGQMWKTATQAIIHAQAGAITPNEAKEAFRDAAEEAGVLVK